MANRFSSFGANVRLARLKEAERAQKSNREREETNTRLTSALTLRRRTDQSCRSTTPRGWTTTGGGTRCSPPIRNTWYAKRTIDRFRVFQTAASAAHDARRRVCTRETIDGGFFFPKRRADYIYILDKCATTKHKRAASDKPETTLQPSQRAYAAYGDPTAYYGGAMMAYGAPPAAMGSLIAPRLVLPTRADD